MMSSYVNDQSRVGRLTYWMYYVGIMVLTWAMYGWGIYEFVKLNLVPIVFGFIAPTILSIYFRIIAMRRCRDIGWPAYLPWLTISLLVACGVISGLQAGLHPGSSLGTIGVSVMLGGVLGLADFIFLIVIGCVGGADTGDDSFEGGHFDRQTLPSAPRGYVSGLDSYARNQRARPMPQAYDEGDTRFSAGNHSEQARPVGGFGRRSV